MRPVSMEEWWNMNLSDMNSEEIWNLSSMNSEEIWDLSKWKRQQNFYKLSGKIQELPKAKTWKKASKR